MLGKLCSYIKKGSYIDLLNRKIFPFVEAEGYENRYPTTSVMSQPSESYREIREASEKLFKIFNKTVKNFQKCPDEFLDLMDIPEKMRKYLNIYNPLDLASYIVRLDYVLDKKNNLKLIEFNADTPCAIVESYYGNGVACKFHNRKDPNEMNKNDLKEAFKQIFSKCNIEGKLIAFTCFDDFPEDNATTKFLMAQAKLAADEIKEENNYFNFVVEEDVIFTSIYTLNISEEALMTPEGRKIDILYRLYPLELLIEETDPEGFPIGEQLMTLCLEGKLTMINPPEAIIMQTKGLQALIWSLAEDDNDFFTESEKRTIKRYMLPSYFDNGWFLERRIDYIKKPIWGREGNGIGIYSKEGELIEEKNEIYYDDVRRVCKSFLYQEFCDSKWIEQTVDTGPIKGKITLSNFVLTGKPSASFCRFSPDRIAGIEAFWLPLIEE